MNTESMQLYDIYGTRHIPWWQTQSFFIVIVILILVIVAACLWFLIKKWRNERLQLTPWDRALLGLDSLIKKYASLEPKEFYSQLMAIVRKYLAARYSYDIEGKTDEELLIFLKTTEFPSSLLAQMHGLFERGVASKFSAKSLIPKSVLHDDALLSRTIITQTIPEQKK